MKLKITNKSLYWGLIITFLLLYVCVGFVSTLHSITFFNLTNSIGLAILLGVTYELGQSTVLFALLMTKNKDKFLPWLLMILLTSLQVTANVYASFKYMAKSGSNDWVYWQKSILFGVQASNSEIYQIIISWIAGALLPIVALGMTALVAQNIKLMEEENNQKNGSLQEKLYPDEKELEDIINNEVNKRIEEKLKSSSVTEKELPNKEETIELINEDEQPILNDIVQEESLIKKRGRPPKKIDIEDAAEPKKEKELLLKEDVKVPKKRKRILNPLKIKEKIRPIKSLDEIIKPEPPSIGDEVIKLIENVNDEKKEDTITTDKIDEPNKSELNLVPPEILTPYIDSGVEVIEAKAIPKPNVKKN